MPELIIKEKGFTGSEQELQEQTQRMTAILSANGYDPNTRHRLSMKEALDTPNAGFIIPRVLTTFVQEGVEPLLIGARLLQRIQWVPGMQQVFPAIDALNAEEVPDGASLPIKNISVGGGETFGVSVQRHGLMLKISQRFIEQSTYPWLQYWMRLAGNALARHKEEYIFSFVNSIGTTIFDNSKAARTTGAPLQPVKGFTTGRNQKGQFNGSMTADDIFDMFAQLVMQGYIPDTVLMHPLTWIMFVKDPVFREFAIQSGGGSFFANFTGNPAALAYPFYNFQGMGAGQGQPFTTGAGAGTGNFPSTTQGAPQNLASAPQFPGYLPTPFRILVSPFVRFDPVTLQTDVMMFNSRNLGALLVDQDPHVNTWVDPGFGIQNVGIEETYGFAILNEGQAIGIARNVKIAQNLWMPQVRPIVDIAGANTVFEETANVEVSGSNPLDILTGR